MNLEKCDKCGNRNIMCFLCVNNKHYRETKYSHNNSIRNNAIDEFVSKINQEFMRNDEDGNLYIYLWIDEFKKIAEQMKKEG